MMTNLFMLAGYTQYQAQCIAPFGYVVAAGILVQAVAPAVDRYIYRRRWEEVQQREAEAAAARAAEQRKEAHRREVMDFLLNEAAWWPDFLCPYRSQIRAKTPNQSKKRSQTKKEVCEWTSTRN